MLTNEGMWAVVIVDKILSGPCERARGTSKDRTSYGSLKGCREQTQK